MTSDVLLLFLTQKKLYYFGVDILLIPLLFETSKTSAL